jgi:hypothetical protein
MHPTTNGGKLEFFGGKSVGSGPDTAEFFDIDGGRALLTVLDFETHPLTFFERFESLSLDGGIMDEDISTVFLLNEPPTFLVVEPLYCSFKHAP